jgi:Uma2 family endonuclease
MSPDDTIREVEEKAQAWLAAGTLLVWVVNPKNRTVTVYRPLSDIQTLTEADQLDGEDVVPGFRCQIADVFGSMD